MAYTNNNKRLVDLPVWEYCNFAPTSTTAISCLTKSKRLNGRYLYYTVSGSHYRYDTTTNVWSQLTNVTSTPTTFVSTQYDSYEGHRGKVISCPSPTTLQVPGLTGKCLEGFKIRIISGTGAGQERTITSVADAVIHDMGLATSSANSSLTDSTKKYKSNQWAGYQVRMTFGTGNTQVRKILYNDATAITWASNNILYSDNFGNTVAGTSPSTTAGSQTHYQIESHVITVDLAWTINPDYTSRFKVLSGGIWLFTSASTNFYSMQFYDELADVWQTKINNLTMYPAAFGTDGAIINTEEVSMAYESGTVTSATSFRLVDTTKTFEFGKYQNYRVRITGGTGIGQNRRIQCSGTNYIEVAKKWEVTPDATSTYEIIADTDKLYIIGNAQSAMLQYDKDSSLMIQGHKFDDGVVCNASIRYPGIDAVVWGVSGATRSTGGITAVNATPTVAGTGYVVGDRLTVSTGGSSGVVIVESVGASGAVLSISLIRCGSSYTTGVGKATTGGTGSGCTIEITSIGTVGRITTVFNTNIKQGEQIILAGASEAAWNGTYTVLASDANTTFDVVTTATTTLAFASTDSTTLIVDSSKNWDVDEHKGKLVTVALSGTGPTTQVVPITSNTATTLVVPTITDPTNGQTIYCIVSPNAFGRDESEKVDNLKPNGHATGGSTTTLVDSTKKWAINKWAGARLRIESGTGRGADIVVTSNTETTLTYATQSFTPDTTSHYAILDVSGTASSGSTTTLVDTTKNWKVNQFAGKRFRITGGVGMSNEVAITSNTATTLTYATQTFTPDTTTTYTILGAPNVGAGTHLSWLFGGYSNGRYMVRPRGGASNAWDIYDITLDKWDYGIMISPFGETLTTGTMYAYDGEDSIFFQKDSTERIFEFNFKTRRIDGAGKIPYSMSTALIGNRMEVVESDDGIKYLYLMRHSDTPLFRTMISWK